ncbi:MAG: hypothetical protein KJ052_14735 [Candidatus Hydrogenedentes bacterium]|nr:hypothetical protein [Candidatus Hydrogenedentota bacterium]
MATAMIPSGFTQSLTDELLGGALIEPKTGQWVRYDVIDAKSNEHLLVRQAIVEKERVKRKQGWWLEIDIRSGDGSYSVVKMLLTGPASNSRNVVKIFRKQGIHPPEELPVESIEPDEKTDSGKSKRKSLGLETLLLSDNTAIRAEHWRIMRGEKELHLWSSNSVRPSGIVRLETADGVMMLRDFGVGGELGKSVLDHTQTSKNEEDGQPEPQEDSK